MPNTASPSRTRQSAVKAIARLKACGLSHSEIGAAAARSAGWVTLVLGDAGAAVQEWQARTLEAAALREERRAAIPSDVHALLESAITQMAAGMDDLSRATNILKRVKR